MPINQYFLKGNAEFVFTGQLPKIDTKTKFKHGCTGIVVDDYGLTEATFTFYTISPRARVKYVFVDMEGKILLPEQGEIKDGK